MLFRSCFATLREGDGTEIQAMLSLDRVGGEMLEAWKRLVDLGDTVAIEGEVITSKRGELSVLADRWVMAAKALRPLPVSHKPMSEEARIRQRYVDLIMRPQARQTVHTRATVVRSLRESLQRRGFIEVETPMLQLLHGGAAARPFVTRANALDLDLYLRIAPELFLKRCVVGGIDKVFEINRNFRNEGISTRHNPEFTMLEFYEAYRDYHYMMDLTEDLIREVAQEVLGRTSVEYQGMAIDLGKPFDRLTMAQAIHQYNTQHPLPELAKADYLKAALAPYGVDVFATDGLGLLQLKLFEATTEAKLVQPTFIIAHPTDVSPLARANDANPAVTDRFELFITGREMANGFSELNDPEEQAARFQAQVDARAAGDEEAMYFDADYLRAMEYGLPPTAGEGIGIDRLVMLLTDSPSIRDVILFPQLKPEG